MKQAYILNMAMAEGAEMKSYGIYTRNQSGTTIYYIGRYTNEQEAQEAALLHFVWYALEPEKYSIVKC